MFKFAPDPSQGRVSLAMRVSRGAATFFFALLQFPCRYWRYPALGISRFEVTWYTIDNIQVKLVKIW